MRIAGQRKGTSAVPIPNVSAELLRFTCSQDQSSWTDLFHLQSKKQRFVAFAPAILSNGIKKGKIRPQIHQIGCEHK